ncbi:MAG: sugar isomerase [Cytophagaceae bacterium]
MIADKNKLAASDKSLASEHEAQFDFLADRLSKKGHDVKKLLKKISGFQIAVPSWALGTGGTRFGRFPMGGEPRTLDEKIEDVALLHTLTGSCERISLHIPWDIPSDIKHTAALLKKSGLIIDSVNSNTFQDQEDQKHSYKFGSLSHSKEGVRQQAIEHNLEVVNIGEKLGAKALTVWLADGSNFPGQQDMRHAFRRTSDSLNKIYKGMKKDWTMLIEYKPFEPNFYSMVIPDWGTAYLLAKSAGERARILVDLGHHLPNTNIEQIVARLMDTGNLGGFHFNGSMYADDDLTTGAIKPYQLFLIFNELTGAMMDKTVKNPEVAWMIDASHNTKDPLEDLLQSIEGILIAYAQSMLVDREALKQAQDDNDVTLAQELLQNAFRTDVRPLLAEARKSRGVSLSPLHAYRKADIRKQLTKQRSK